METESAWPNKPRNKVSTEPPGVSTRSTDQARHRHGVPIPWSNLGYSTVRSIPAGKLLRPSVYDSEDEAKPMGALCGGHWTVQERDYLIERAT